MAKKESINSQIFYALKNSERSGVPVLLIGSAGTGKSTTVEMFAELRGYELLLLRGSTASEQEIMGFMSVHQGEKDVVATNVLPTWYKKLLEYHAAGKKTLLFLDEITAVNPYVQAALLHLIFERKVNEEKLPDDTLIVSAGNYSGNLTNEFELLSPVVNRFAVFNIVPDEDSLDEFLCEYKDAGLGGKRKTMMEEKAEMLKKMDEQEIFMDEDTRNRVGNYFETAIRETTRQLIKSGDKPLSFSCTDTQSIYKAQDGDELLRGFISLRSLSYLKRLTMAIYENFGPNGIKGKNYEMFVEGLVGIALSRNNGEVKATKVAKNYTQSIIQTLASISKLSNTKIKEYEEFFSKVVTNSKTSMSVEDVTVIINKIKEMNNDSGIKDVTKPLDDSVVTKLCDLMKYNAQQLVAIKINPSDDMTKILTVEKMAGLICKWNQLTDLFTLIEGMVTNPKNTYPDTISKAITTSKEKMTEYYMKLGSFAKLTAVNFPKFKSTIPEIKSLKK